MEFPPQSGTPPRPKPRSQPRRPIPPQPAQTAPPLPQSQVPHPLNPSRPGVLVEATQPFNVRDPRGMMRFVFESRIQDSLTGKVREVTISQDKMRAFVEFSHPEVIPQLLSVCGDLRDPHTQLPLTVSEMDLMTVWPPFIVITGFPPFANEQMLREHFERVANGQQVQSVSFSQDKQEAMVMYAYPAVAFDVVSLRTQLFGSDLHLELRYYGPSPAEPEQPPAAVEGVNALCVQGLPESMLGNPAMASEALKHFIKGTTGFEAASCEVVNGIAYLTFSDLSAAPAIVANPPSATFMAGSALHMSLTSPLQHSPVQTSHEVPLTERAPPKEAWGPPPGGQLPGSTSPNNRVTAPVEQSTRPPVAPRRRHVSDNKEEEQSRAPRSGDQAPPGDTGLERNQWNRDSFSDQFPQQQSPQSHLGPIPHSASSPGGLESARAQYGPQLQQQPIPGYYYPHPTQHLAQHRQTQSLQYQFGHGQAVPSGDSWHPHPVLPGSQQGSHETGQPPSDSMLRDCSNAPQANCRKILIDHLPTEARNTTALKYYFLGLAHGPVDSVVVHADCAVVTFNNPISLEELQQQVRQTPFEGETLALSPLRPSDKILISGLSENFSEMSLKYGLCHQAGELNSVKSIERVSPTQALVTFKSPDSAQKVASKSQLELEDLPNKLSVKEYYDFMEASETGVAPQPTASSLKQDGQPPTNPTQHAWGVQRELLTKEQHFYLELSLPELNEKLHPLKAHAEIERKGKQDFSIISPLDGSEAMDDWEREVTGVRTEHLAELSVETVSFPREARADVQDYIYDHSDSIFVVKRAKESLVIAGQKEVIAEACKDVAEMSLEYQITTRTIDLPRVLVKFLERFCVHDFKKLESISFQDLLFNPDTGSIVVTANPIGHSDVDKVIELANEAERKNVDLSCSAYKLLSSQRGASKLKEVLNVASAQFVYDLEQFQDPSDDSLKYRICFLSKTKETLKTVKQKVKVYIHEEEFQTTAAKIRVCSSKEWREFVSNLCEEHFVMITAREESNTIIVTGEMVVCRDIVEKTKRFLEKHTNIEERVTVSKSEWYIINSNFNNEMNGVNEQAKKKQVKIEWPKKSNVTTLAIVISGEPVVVDDIKVQVEMLKAKVCTKEARIAGIPAVVHVLESMEDRLRIIENDEKVRIEVNLENGEDESAAAAQAVGEVPRQVCSGTSPKGTRVSIYTGDSTQNAPVGVMVNFIIPEPDPHTGHLKHLLESGGPDAVDDFKRKKSQFLTLEHGKAFKTRYGQLRCSQLVHCVLPPWKSQESDASKEYFLESSLKKVLEEAEVRGSILLTPPTTAPLHYPITLFARMLMDTVTFQASSNLHVSVFVEEIQHAKKFEDAFHSRDFQVHTKVPLPSPLLSANRKAQGTAASPPSMTTAKILTGNLSTFITLVNGDLLQQKADVYINSTNTNLNLKQGQLSKLLLNACGDDLQKECSEYAPLKPGKVAVTDAKNLKCNHIFHVALPEYKSINSERVFRETVKQILRIGKDMSVSSIAIPSLGVANLGFPEAVSARILFQEIVAFHSQYPNSIQKFIFVIYEKSVFEAFSREYAQQMSGESKPQASQDPSPVATPTSASQPAGSTLLTVVQGNIAEEKSDIIVNTTAEDMMLNKSAVSKAIAEKAGDELQKTCRQLYENGMRLEHGQTIITRAFGKLHCQKIIHAHLPHRGSMATSSTHHYQLIEKIVTDCLQRAENERMQSISFPAFGLGGGGYSVEQVADPMLKAFQKFGQTHPQSVKSIRVVIYNPKLHKQFDDFYCKFFGRNPADSAPAQGFLGRFLGGSQKPADNSQELQNSASSPGTRATGAPPLWVLTHSIPNPTVVFQIFAASGTKCDRIEQMLRDLISDKSCTKEIKEVDVIEHLADDDYRDIVRTGDQLGVQVKILSKLKEIRISGEKSKVAEAQNEIQKILSEIERSVTELGQYEWQSEDDDGMFESYPPEANIRIERASNRKAKALELTVDGVTVLIDLDASTETDTRTGKMRKIRRVKKTMSSVAFPDTWESLQAGGKKPSEIMQMFDVDQGSQEYADTVREFEESLKRCNIKFSIEKVQRIENKVEYSKHIALNDSIRAKYQGGDVLCKRLFHGSRQDSLNLIAVQGFNRNFAADANAAYFGKGVYFAVEAWYSAQEKYSVPDSSGLQYMFVCRVIIGKYAKGGNNMKAAPPLSPGSSQVFDTLVDKEQSPTIFVAMTDAQAYPEYLITFKKIK